MSDRKVCYKSVPREPTLEGVIDEVFGKETEVLDEIDQEYGRRECSDSGVSKRTLRNGTKFTTFLAPLVLGILVVVAAMTWMELTQAELLGNALKDLNSTDGEPIVVHVETLEDNATVASNTSVELSLHIEAAVPADKKVAPVPTQPEKHQQKEHAAPQAAQQPTLPAKSHNLATSAPKQVTRQPKQATNAPDPVMITNQQESSPAKQPVTTNAYKSGPYSYQNDPNLKDGDGLNGQGPPPVQDKKPVPTYTSQSGLGANGKSLGARGTLLPRPTGATSPPTSGTGLEAGSKLHGNMKHHGMMKKDGIDTTQEPAQEEITTATPEVQPTPAPKNGLLSRFWGADFGSSIAPMAPVAVEEKVGLHDWKKQQQDTPVGKKPQDRPKTEP
jgi:hypothetical protein